jgi:hypothetical protein
VAREIGYLIMYAANLEIMFVSILTALQADDPLIPVSIGTQVENLGAKLQIMFDVAEAMPDDPLAAAVSTARPDIEKAIAFRNGLVHALFVFDEPNGEFQVARGFLTNRRGKPRWEPLLPSTIKDHRELLRKAISDINRAGSSRIRNPMEVPYRA